MAQEEKDTFEYKPFFWNSAVNIHYIVIIPGQQHRLRVRDPDRPPGRDRDAGQEGAPLEGPLPDLLPLGRPSLQGAEGAG